MLLCHLLQTRQNNLNLFRIIAALLVIFGHAPAFIVDEQSYDFIAALLGFDYSASLAVKFFFMLSGLLVTHSLLARPQVIPFLIRRAARIFPGLLVCIFLTVFILGLIATNLSAREYLLHPQTWRYWLNNSVLIDLQWQLPGVFSEGKSTVVNGSLWTLPLEAMCYFSLAVFFVFVLQRAERFAAVILLLVISVIFVGSALWPQALLAFKESLLLGGCFCIGALAAVQQRKLSINVKGVAAGLLVLVLLWQTPLQQIGFYGVFFYTCLYVSGTRLFTQTLRLPGDPSYGIYIYGFIIQQCLATIFPAQGILFNQISAALIALVIGYLSWYFIEKPAMQRVRTFIHG